MAPPIIFSATATTSRPHVTSQLRSSALVYNPLTERSRVPSVVTKDSQKARSNSRRGNGEGVKEQAADSSCESAPAAFHDSRKKEHNSVTVKHNTSVKDAAGAIVKVLNRTSSLFVTALKLNVSHEALNRAVKSIAVARKYLKDESARGLEELSFLPMNRTNEHNQCDPTRFAFLVFKTGLLKDLKETDETDLNVSRASDPNKMANAILSIVLTRGQAIMKAGGAEALFIAMSSVIKARNRLKRNHHLDIMLLPTFITEDTTSSLGRESKFLKFNILPCPVNGPLTTSADTPSNSGVAGTSSAASEQSSTPSEEPTPVTEPALALC